MVTSRAFGTLAGPGGEPSAASVVGFAKGVVQFSQKVFWLPRNIPRPSERRHLYRMTALKESVPLGLKSTGALPSTALAADRPKRSKPSRSADGAEGLSPPLGSGSVDFSADRVANLVLGRSALWAGRLNQKPTRCFGLASAPPRTG